MSENRLLVTFPQMSRQNVQDSSVRQDDWTDHDCEDSYPGSNTGDGNDNKNNINNNDNDTDNDNDNDNRNVVSVH